MESLHPAAAGSRTKTIDRIPVTLLTGFLGAGKTTLLNHLMKQPEMAGAAVLINEFGEVGIDHHLVERVDETLMILDSGCLCCSMQGDLAKALKNLSTRSSRREIPPVTRVLIETTGLADPVPVIYTLMEHPFVAPRYVCDGVVTVVDATHGVRQLAEHSEAMRQVAMADRLLISKSDLCDRTSRDALDETLATLNPAAPRIAIRHGRVEPGVVFGGGVYTSDGKLPDVAAWLGEEAARDLQARAATAPVAWRKGVAAPVHAPARRHDERVRSFVVDFGEPVGWYGFAAAMGRILTNHGAHVLRVKGLMSVAGAEDTPMVVHCVQDVAYPPLRLPAWPAQSPFEDRRGRLVFIVRDLTEADEAAIRASLADLPRTAAAVRAVAATPLLPTRCWLNERMPTPASSAITVDGWVVQPKRFKAAS
ncbi:GTP-binding protein [Azoarcus sp. KH32C]|uniref:CobW family GTP-binding protein n=1 Tax=Azoarcus sp. KH32C TaxID=748247 RepID=UPI0002386CAF|nr:GTP-binding protein [Azoarcus sp. KH32C]BAL25454.1 cobalamin synthesis protein/P47K family protein [Azoarcus sp. KH32C]